MIRKINTHTAFDAGSGHSALIIIDKNGMRIEEKRPLHQSDFSIIQHFIIECIDMDNWKYSWHLDVSKAKNKNTEERTKIRQILKDKIQQRQNEIQKLKDCSNVLEKW